MQASSGLTGRMQSPYWSTAALAFLLLAAVGAGLLVPFYGMNALIALVAGGVFVAFLYRPQLAVVAILLLVGVFPELNRGVNLPLGGIGQLYMSDVLLVLCMATAAGKKLFRLKQGKGAFHVSGTSVALLVFGGALILSALVGMWKGNDFLFVRREIRFLSYYALYFAIVGLSLSRQQATRLLFGLVITGTAMALRGIWDYSQGNASPLLVTGSDSLLAFRSFGNIQLVVASAILLGLFTYATVRQRIIIGVALGVNTIALFLTFGRTLWIAMGAALLVVFLLLSARGKLQLLLGCAVLFLGLSLASFWLPQPNAGGEPLLRLVYGRAASLHSVDDSLTGSSRLIEAREAIGSFWRSPLLGNGLGYRYLFSYLPGDMALFIDIHNSYLYFLSKAGIPGFLSLALLLVMAFRSGYRLYRRCQGIARGQLLGILAAMAALATSSVAVPSLNTLEGVMTMATLMAILEVYGWHHHGKQEQILSAGGAR